MPYDDYGSKVVFKAELADVIPGKLSLLWIYYSEKAPSCKTWLSFDAAVLWLEANHYTLSDVYIDDLGIERFVFFKYAKKRQKRQPRRVNTPELLREKVRDMQDGIPF